MKTELWIGLGLACVVAMSAAGGVAQAQQGNAQTVELPTSKQLMAPAPGDPRRLNSLPTSMAVSPDGRWVLSLNQGYGTFESQYKESIAVLDTMTGAVKDFPDDRVGERASQTFFSGLAIGKAGTKVYASLAAVDAADGDKKTGSGIIVYKFGDGVLTPESFWKLPDVKLAAGRQSAVSKSGDPSLGVAYPAAIAVLPSDRERGVGERLLVAENLSDTVVLLDASTGKVERTFDLSENDAIPSTYPIAVVVSRDRQRAFVALWNASEVVELDLDKGTVSRKVTLMKPTLATAPGSHPCALELDENAAMLYVALANRDVVAALEIGKQGEPQLTVRGYFDTRLPGQSYFGAVPNALALNGDGSRLYVANMGSDAVAVLDTRKLKTMAKAKGMVEPAGFVPTELMPMALASSGGKLYVASGKGKGTGPNNFPQQPLKTDKNGVHGTRGFTYAPTLLYGSLAVLDEGGIEPGLKASTEVVLESNRMKAGAETIQFAKGGSPIKHVIYIIKENRTYDQVLGDLNKDGKPVGDGEKSLAMYGAGVTPNQHKLALQFGVLDNFYDSGEVSGSGHVWSNAAMGTDYLEKTWQINYRGDAHTYDYEGMVANGYPLLQHIPDVNEPTSGYLWTNMAAHGKTVYHFAEYINSIFCGDKNAPRSTDPKQGAMSGGVTSCPSDSIKPGEPLPAEWGGGMNLWPWAIPRLAGNVATKPELVGHFAPESPDFNLRVPDQIRVQIFLRHLEQWKRDLAAGNDTMPNFIQLRLPNDHTEGTRPGGPTPKASVSDNDLAIGRAVEAISHSGFWDNTAFFILEDDAQNGADHVDAHRSIALVVSKYSPHPKAGEAAVVDSRFYSTVSVVRTMETLLGVPPMNNNDAFASLISKLFTGPGDQPAFAADTTNRDNKLIYTANKPSAPGARASLKMDFSHADRADASKLNLILWQDAMGSQAPPQMLLQKLPKKKDDDD